MDVTVTSLLCVMVLYICDTSATPAQLNSWIHNRLPRGYSDDRIIRSDMTATDQIIEANEFRTAQIPEVTSFRDGDIAVTTGGHSKVCFARSCQWSKSVDGHVYVAYRLSSDYSSLDQRIIKTGMDQIESGTCVRFVPRTHERDYLDIQPQSGCWSYLGQRGGRQTLSLQSPDCMWSGVATHEFMHALGFVHEQSRVDRDQYVTVIWDNILKGHAKSFEKFKTNNLDTPYDYESIMHFGMYAYSEEGDPTIIPKRNKIVKVGQRTSLSALDKMKINKLYNCEISEDY
ncbi:hypothetical protein DPEC_G00135410 [Dallia pectoralis]|uniref:Uncharacterized protein n=1 Tax=Dallia pectoralis TaxID=75939 RepID=A0ACC2GKX9_DALPE|nr:hypothetical protein DPEC_G00135410 [Dallia pectoralis]